MELDANRTPPAPPPPVPTVPGCPPAAPPPPATTKYSIVFEPSELPTEQTVKVPGPVNVCVLKSPQGVVAIVPPVAAIYDAVGADV